MSALVFAQFYNLQHKLQKLCLFLQNKNKQKKKEKKITKTKLYLALLQ